MTSLLWFISIAFAEDISVQVPSISTIETVSSEMASLEGQKTDTAVSEDIITQYLTAMQERDCSAIDELFPSITNPSSVQLISAADCAMEKGRLDTAYEQYRKALSKRFSREEPRHLRLIEAKTAQVVLKGAGELIFEGDEERVLLRAVDTANEDLRQKESFSGRLPVGLYRFQEGGLLISKTGLDIIDVATLDIMIAHKKEIDASFYGLLQETVSDWMIEPTSYRAKAGLHMQYFGSENADVAMQSFWSLGPTVGMIWKKNRGDWGLGLESNAYISASTKAFMFGLNGNAFAEYVVPKGTVRSGLRYDFSVGRIVGITLAEQIGTITKEELDSLAIAGVALSLGLWGEYSYPIRSNTDVFLRLGMRNDGKRMYFDTDIGAIFPLPF